MFYTKTLKHRQGFTLIELLVVIAIIGILASVVLASLSNSRASARDTKRLAEVKQFQTALELFRNNNSNRYPCSTGNWDYPANRVQLLDGSAQTGSVTANNRPAGCSDIRSLITMPLDSFYTGTTDQILYRSVPAQNGTNYVLRVRMEGDRYNTTGNSSRFCLVIHGTATIPVAWEVYPTCF